jgi:hypothetical protein
LTGKSYESPFEDVFVGGWSRQASSGLVGVARKDGTNASKAVWQYLQQTKQPIEPKVEAVAAKLKSLGKPIVLKEDIKRLEALEIAETQKRGVEEFKYDNNDEMLQAMGLKEHSVACPPACSEGFGINQGMGQLKKLFRVNILIMLFLLLTACGQSSQFTPSAVPSGNGYNNYNADGHSHPKPNCH